MAATTERNVGTTKAWEMSQSTSMIDDSSDFTDAISVGSVHTSVSSQDDFEMRSSCSSEWKSSRTKNKIAKNKTEVLPVDISRTEQRNVRTVADIVQAAANMSADVCIADQQSEEGNGSMMPLFTSPPSQVRQTMRTPSRRASSSLHPRVSGRRQCTVVESSDSEMDIPNTMPLHHLAHHRASSLAAGRRRIQASMTRVESVKPNRVENVRPNRVESMKLQRVDSVKSQVSMCSIPMTPESRYWSSDTNTLGFSFEDLPGARSQSPTLMTSSSSPPRPTERVLNSSMAAQAQQEFGYPHAGACFGHASGMYTSPEQAFYAGGYPLSAQQPYGGYLPQNQGDNFFGMEFAQAPQMIAPEASLHMQAMPPFHQGPPDFGRGRPERWNTPPVAYTEEVVSGAGTGIFATRAVPPPPQLARQNPPPQPARQNFSPPRAEAKQGSSQRSADRSADQGPVTTIMLRNIPQKYDREMLLEDMNARGFKGAYDFFYMPIDFSTTHTVGYAFINFVSEAELARFSAVYVGLKLRQDSPKVISICDAKLQGQMRNVDFYRNSTVMNMDVQYHPLLFSNGVRFSLPAPTRTLGPVQRRPARAGGNLKTQQAQSSTNQSKSSTNQSKSWTNQSKSWRR